MQKRVSASRTALPRKRRDDLDDLFASVSPDAAAFVNGKVALRTKLMRAVERLGEAFPGRTAHLHRYQDPESGEWDLFVEVQRGPDLEEDYEKLRAVETQWIHDREDPTRELTFSFYFGR